MLELTGHQSAARGISRNRRERPECKAHGAQEPQCTCWYMRIPSTAQRSNRVAQQVSRGSPYLLPPHLPSPPLPSFPLSAASSPAAAAASSAPHLHYPHRSAERAVGQNGCRTSS